MTVRLLTGDCREIMPKEGPFDMILADPPYGDTSLPWDRWPNGWVAAAAAALRPTGSLWCFGSMRMFLDRGAEFRAAGLRYAQDVVWEKHNGSGSAADRFRRVHEHAAQFYSAAAPWGEIFNEVQFTNDATARKLTRKSKPEHWGGIGQADYETKDGDPRLMRSVIAMRSMHHRAIHPTEKPAALLEILIRTSCPPGGLVGDWFAGSGAAGDACQMAGRRYIGCEGDEKMAAKALDRLGSMLPFGGTAA